MLRVIVTLLPKVLLGSKHAIVGEQVSKLKKGNMSLDEYTNAFTDKMEFSQHIVPNELMKIDRYAKGLPWEYYVPVCQALTLEVVIWVAKLVEDMMKGRTVSKAEFGEKTKGEGLPKSYKQSRSINRNFGGNNEAKWYDNFRNKHFVRCTKEMTCFKCEKISHNANESTAKKEVLFECGEEGNFKQDCPKRKGAANPNVQPKSKSQAF